MRLQSLKHTSWPCGHLLHMNHDFLLIMNLKNSCDSRITVLVRNYKSKALLCFEHIRAVLSNMLFY